MMHDHLSSISWSHRSRDLREHRFGSLALAFVLSLLMLVPAVASAQASVRAATAWVATGVPAGFTKTLLAQGLKNPSTFAFAANGDIYIGEKPGDIVIYRNGAVMATPVVSLITDSGGEKGLLGIALDPNFATNGYLYISYTTLDEHAQLSRLTVVNGIASQASEKIIMRGNQLQNVHHSANDLKIGPDGKLWWSVGDNVPDISNGQTLVNIYGKMLRFNLDGTVPSDNPFVNIPGAVPSIYAYGLRNPFRFTFLPNGKAMTEDTGSNYWEEMNTIQSGGNYGWDFFEGNCGSCGYINPAYAYGHAPIDGAASAIAAYSGSVFPSQYNHVVFFGDYNRRDIEAVTFDPTYTTEISDTIFDNSAGTIANLAEGPDGNLYYVSIFEGTFTKISATGPFAPTATASASPNASLAAQAVTFSSAGSNDPYGKPLSYAWDFGDGTAVSTAANPTHTFTKNGTYAATLTVNNGSQTGTTTTSVVIGHTPPTASISAPATYNAGAIVAFSGTATDENNTTLPASAYTWQVDFISNGVAQPFYSAEVAHPFSGPLKGVTSGTFQIPTDPSNTAGTLYRVTMTVVDAQGIATVSTRDIQPNLTTWTVNTNVSGAAFVVDGTWHTSTYTTQDVVGVTHVLASLPTQTIGAQRYRFHGWSDGSSLADTFTTTAANQSFTANEDQTQSTMPTPWQSSDVGTPLMPGTTDYATSSQSFYLDGAGADIFGANDQYHFVSQTLNGDGTIIARVRYQTESSPWAKAGVMIQDSGSTNYLDALVTPNVSPLTPNTNGVNCTPNGCDSPLPPITPPFGYGVRMQYDFTGSSSVTSATALAGFTSPNEWVKLQRVGNTFTTWYSTDGTNWTQIGSTSITMSAKTSIGLFVNSHNIGQYSSAAFDNVQVTGATVVNNNLPTPWVDTDVGAPSIGGSATAANGVFTVNGSGADIWGTLDQFNYVNQPANGDTTLIARITSQTNTSSNAKAGIMFKDSTTAGSPYILIADNGAGTVKVQYSFNGSTAVAGTFAYPNTWMKLSRVGSVFTASTSSDGITWTPIISKTLALGTNATAGLFVCAHNAKAIGTATFDHVSVTQP